MSKTKKSMNPLTLILVLSSLFFAAFIVISATLFMNRSGSDSEVTSSGGTALFSKDSVGILEVRGVILDSKRTLKQLRSFEKADSVKAIVLRLNSPGGSVAPSQEIYEAVRAIKKPVIVSMGSVAASGAYYIAMGADKVFANAGTLTGSIGVIMEFTNLKELYKWAKIKRYSIKTGRYKDSGTDHRDMRPDEKALLQKMIDNVLGQFKKAVAQGRKLSSSAVDRVADGRILSGEQAKEAKLIDEIGTIDDAIAAAAKMGGIKGQPKRVYPRKKRSNWLDVVMDRGQDEEDEYGFRRPNNQIQSLISQLVSVPVQKVTGLTPGIYWLWTGAI